MTGGGFLMFKSVTVELQRDEKGQFIILPEGVKLPGNPTSFEVRKLGAARIVLPANRKRRVQSKKRGPHA